MSAGGGEWLSARGVMVAVVLFAGLLCAHAETPEKPIPKALPVADDEPQTKVLTKMMEGADQTLAKRDKKKDTPLARYERQVRSQVDKKWHIYLNLRRAGLTAGYLELVFYVNKKGRVEDLRVVNDKESHPVLTAVTLQAIKDAEMPPMPAEVIPLLPKGDPERLKMEYNVLVYEDKPAVSKTPEKPKAAVDEDKTAKGRYTRLVLAQVEKKWKEYRQQRVAADVRAGGLRVEFYVNKLGRVEGVRATDLQKSYPILTGFTLRAVKDAEIPPMPADVIPLLPKDDPERLKIDYHVLVD